MYEGIIRISEESVSELARLVEVVRYCSVDLLLNGFKIPTYKC